MKAPVFAYTRAESVGHALDLLAQHGDAARPLAGGQSLVPALNMRLASPALLVDINDLDQLSGIAAGADGIRIGAMTRHRTLEDSARIAADLPLITQAIVHVAHPAVRNRGTLGGSLAAADPAAELPACCVALDATVVLRSTRGERRVPATSFFVDLLETALAPDELITHVEIPRVAPGIRSVFLEIARRHGDYATIGIAALGRLVDDRWLDLRIALLGAGRTVRVAGRAAGVLAGRSWCTDALREAQDALAADIEPLDDLYTSAATRRHLARVLLARALARLGADAP